MKHARAYIQPSDIEGLSPVILENMGLGTPVICSDIRENLFVVGDTAVTFNKGDIDNLLECLEWSLEHPETLAELGVRGQRRAQALFGWDAVADAHVRVFAEHGAQRGRPTPAAGAQI